MKMLLIPPQLIPFGLEELQFAYVRERRTNTLMVQISRLDHLLVGQSVHKVYCGKMAERICMLFGMVSGVSQGIGILDGACYRRRRRDSFGVNLGHLIVTSGDFDYA